MPSRHGSGEGKAGTSISMRANAAGVLISDKVIPMTLDEWIAFYNSKTPEKFVRDERYEFFFSPEKGFCEVGMTKNMLVIHQLAGDARYWKNRVSKAARRIGLKMCGTWCIRKEILAYIRLFGYKIEYKEELPDGLSRYHCKNKKGKHGLASPSFRYKDDGTQAYFITWEP